MPEYLTACFTINNPDSFAVERAQIMENLTPSDGKDWAVTAVSLDHEMHRIDLIEQALEKGGYEALDLIETICAHSDIGNIRSIDELCE